MNTAILIIAALVALAWTSLAIRLIALSRGKWFRFLKAEEGPMLDFPTVEAVVPARNEAANVEATIEALRAQEYPRLSITVVDDQSTDSTAEILDRLSRTPDPRAPLRVVRGVDRPEGWVGKTWAVHQGAAGASSDWIWFVDADMGLHPKALASTIAEADRSGADFVSLLPGVRCETFWQGAIASSFLQLLGQLYPLDRVNDPARPEAIAAGGFILVRRSTYERAGGHEAVRRAIIEDIQLARRVKESGGKLLVRLAPLVGLDAYVRQLRRDLARTPEERLRRDGLHAPQVYHGRHHRPDSGLDALDLAGGRFDERKNADDGGRGLGNPVAGGRDPADPGLSRITRPVRLHVAGGDRGLCRDRLGERLAPPSGADLVERPIDPVRYGCRPRPRG